MSPLSDSPEPQGDFQARFGAAIRSRRAELRITQEELAWRADMHRTYIADIERGGRNITLRSIVSLAKALQVSAGSLFDAGLDGSAAPDGRTLGEIVLVEDNPADAELALRAFKVAKVGNPVRVIPDGAQALEYLLGRKPGGVRRNPLPRLVLLDLNLPQVSGLEVLRALKNDEQAKSIPVIVLTVSRNDSDIIESGRLGAEDYIVKPVDFENLSQVTPRLGLNWALLKEQASAS